MEIYFLLYLCHSMRIQNQHKDFENPESSPRAVDIEPSVTFRITHVLILLFNIRNTMGTRLRKERVNRDAECW